jgi:lipopolysaccharide biosynthesis regulator YciM
VRWWKRARKRPRAPGTSDAAVREALYALLDRDHERAEAMLAQAVRLDPDEIDAYLMLGRLYRERGEVGRAIRIHQNLMLRPELERERATEVLTELACDFRAGGFLRRAIASFEEVLSRDPRRPRALRELAGLLAAVQEHERAIAVERKLARAEGRDAAPREAALWVEVARASEAEGRAAEARKALKRAVRKEPGNVEAWVLLGRIHAEEKRTKAAIAAWRRVPEIERSAGPRVYPQLAASYAAAGRPRDFEKLLHELLAKQGEDAHARLALAGALAARGETDAALRELRVLLEREPGSLPAHVALGRALLSAGREADALQAYRDLLASLERQEQAPETLA